MPPPVARCKLRTALLLFALLFPATFAFAHPEGISGLRLLVWPDHARAILTVHTRDMSNWFPPRQYPDYVPGVCRAMTDSVADILQFSVDDNPVTPTHVSATSPEVGLIKLEVDYPIPTVPAPAHMQIWSRHLIQLPRGHQQVLQADDMRGQPLTAEQGHYLKDDTLDTDHDASDFDLPKGPLPTSAPTTQSTAQQLPSPASATITDPSAPALPRPWLLTVVAFPLLAFCIWRSHRRRITFQSPISKRS